jgi:hypothetical protein
VSQVRILSRALPYQPLRNGAVVTPIRQASPANSLPTSQGPTSALRWPSGRRDRRPTRLRSPSAQPPTRSCGAFEREFRIWRFVRFAEWRRVRVSDPSPPAHGHDRVARAGPGLTARRTGHQPGHGIWDRRNLVHHLADRHDLVLRAPRVTERVGTSALDQTRPCTASRAAAANHRWAARIRSTVMSGRP